MSNSVEIKYSKMAQKLSKVSDCFCLAKWLQVTIHLHLGRTHSCHHPEVHLIPKDEVIKNPAALHNTPLKIRYRKQMLMGIRPFECHYCWDVDDSKDRVFSDRVTKSSDFWAEPFYQEVVKSGAGENIIPRYLEISFGNECNFKCLYCFPIFSSAIWSDCLKVKDTRRGKAVYNYYKNKFNGMNFSSDNVYVTAFWKWFPKISNSLKIFRITGGEPLLNSNTFKVLDYLDENPAPDLELNINSNMSLSIKKMVKFYERIKKLLDNNKIKEFRMFGSIDTIGKQAEYVRYGLDSDLFFKNVNKYLDYNIGGITFMITYNIFSPFKFNKFLKKIIDIKRKYLFQANEFQEEAYIVMSVALMHSPEHLSVKILPKEFHKYINSNIKYMKKNNKLAIGDYGFSETEINRLEQILSVLKTGEPVPNLDKNRSRFKYYVDEHDENSNLNFVETFPELESFYSPLLADLNDLVW